MDHLVVLHSCPIWLPQTQTWMYNQVAALQRLGIDAHVVCEQCEHLEQFRVGNIHCLADRWVGRRLWDRGLRKLRVRRHLEFTTEIGRWIGAGILHTHFGNIGWANLGVARRLGIPHVVTFYGVDINKLPSRHPVWLRRYRDLFLSADRFVCEGPHMAASLAALGCPTGKIRVQHLGVDLGRIRYQPRHWATGEPLRVLIAASFREKKGIPYAIQAVAKLSKVLAVELTVIGDAGQEAEGRAEKQCILAALEQANLGSSVRMLGYQPHSAFLREAYSHHVYLHPSVTATDGDCEGGAPVAIIEALATGMLVVATRHCDIPDVVPPALHRMLAPERDADALYEIVAMIASSRLEWDGWTRAARRYVEREFDSFSQGRKLAALYAELVEARQLPEGMPR